MNTSRPLVVLGLLGSTLDAGFTDGRWERWRPSVALCQQEDLLVDRFELLCEKRCEKLAEVVCGDIAIVSPETKVNRHPVHFRDPWALEDVYGALHDFARTYPFDPEREDYLIHITTGTHVVQICLFLLTEARYLPARLLQTAPARSRSGAPGPVAGTYRILDLDLSKYDRLASRFAREQQEGLSFLKAGIPTRNAAFNALIEQIERVAIQTPDPILLTGPTGAGKSALARRIHELKKQRRQVTGRLVEVNCATLRGDSAMSTLFGHQRGAFTGALKDRPGLLCEADGGMLFLDEIGELGLDEQAMLLHAIEEKKFLPVGSDRESRSDFQLLCGTNRHLMERVREGRFREDLLARIDLWSFRLPGLAERREDIAPNLAYELERFARRTNRQVTLSREARDRFLAFAESPRARWAGNFRDLAAVVTRLATLAAGGRITVALVEQEIARLETAWAGAAPAAEQALDPAALLAEVLGPEVVETLDPFDRPQLAYVLAVCRQSRSLSEAGRELFAVSRTQRRSTNDADRLRKYLARFGLDWSQVGGALGTALSGDLRGAGEAGGVADS